jgi:hypothetical protein
MKVHALFSLVFAAAMTGCGAEDVPVDEEPVDLLTANQHVDSPTLEVEGPSLGLGFIADLTKTNAYLAPYGLEAISPDGQFALVGVSAEAHRDFYRLGAYNECYAFIVAKEIGTNRPVNFFDAKVADEKKARKFWAKHWRFEYEAGAVSLTQAPGEAGIVNATTASGLFFSGTMGQREFATLTPDASFSGDFGFVSKTDPEHEIFNYSVFAAGYRANWDPSKGDTFTFGAELQELMTAIGVIAPFAWVQTYDLYAAIE